MGTIFTTKEFLKYCKERLLIDYDGFGYWLDENKVSTGIFVKPSHMKSDAKSHPKYIYPYVEWFNR